MRILAAALGLAVAACTPAAPGNDSADGNASAARTVAPVLTDADARDPHSYARPEIARVTHVALDIGLDFDAKRVSGTATLDVQAADGAQEIVLDSKGLEIEAVTNADGGAALPFQLGASDAAKGAPLTVQLNGARKIAIRYRTGETAEALQWLSPDQTAGKQHPYLLSQGQPTLNRSWIPTQDSPGIRQTWEARVTAPAALKVVMSGDRLTPEGEDAGEGRKAYRFAMNHPVAPYLIAIASGDLAFRELGPRTGVWTEPAMLDRAATELADTERMVEAAEALYGPYRWGRYDVIVLPPSFPYGGMENPTLTFLTPTFIAGDKSLVGLVAHELAHSWSGNLVTNANWADSWLNEGFTSYFENRIMEAIYGDKRARQEAALSFDDLQGAITEEGATSPKTRLHLADAEATPDGGVSGIVYDKGAAFLRTLEKLVGRERWDAYLRSYFDRHAFQPMTSARFLADLRENLVKGDAALEQSLMLQQWVYEPGLPSNVARPEADAFAEVDQAVAQNGLAAPRTWQRWTTAEKLRYLNRQPRTLPRERLQQLETTLDLSNAGNNEVLFAWLNLALANRYDPAVPAAERFLADIGRRKFVLPLFETLWAQGDWGRPIAQRIYQRTRSGYHSVTTGSVDRVLGVR